MLRDSPKDLGNFSHPHPQAYGTDHKLPRLPPDSPSSPERKERIRREENDKLIELLLADLKETEFAYRNYCKILLEEQASLKEYIESILVAHSTLLLTYDINSILSWSEQCKEIYTPYITHFELLGDENRDWVIKRPLMRIRYFVKLCKKLTFLDENPRLKKAFEDCHEVMLLARDKLAYQKELQYNGSSDLIGSAGDEMADGSGSLPLQGSYETLSPTSLLSPFKTFNFDNKIKNSHKQLLPALDPDEAALNARLPSEVGIDANQLTSRVLGIISASHCRVSLMLWKTQTSDRYLRPPLQATIYYVRLLDVIDMEPRVFQLYNSVTVPWTFHYHQIVRKRSDGVQYYEITSPHNDLIMETALMLRDLRHSSRVVLCELKSLDRRMTIVWVQAGTQTYQRM